MRRDDRVNPERKEDGRRKREVRRISEGRLFPARVGRQSERIGYRVDVLDGKVILKAWSPRIQTCSKPRKTLFGIRRPAVDNRLRVSPAAVYPVPGDNDIASKLRSCSSEPDLVEGSTSPWTTAWSLMGTVDAIWQKYHASILPSRGRGGERRLTVQPVGGFPTRTSGSTSWLDRRIIDRLEW